jgi:hypothetical protein
MRIFSTAPGYRHLSLPLPVFMSLELHKPAATMLPAESAFMEVAQHTFRFQHVFGDKT